MILNKENESFNFIMIKILFDSKTEFVIFFIGKVKKENETDLYIVKGYYECDRKFKFVVHWFDALILRIWFDALILRIKKLFLRRVSVAV